MSRLAPLLLSLLLIFPLATVGAASPTAVPAEDLGEGLHMPYDGHPLAMLLRPTLDARYLPAGLDSEAAIRRAVADGTLREPLYPSLQLANDRAFVWLSQFGRSTLGMHSNTLVRCAGTTGFRLLLGSEDCADAQAPSLHFEGPTDTELVCRECAGVGIPERWQRQAPGAQCALPHWNLDAARLQYRAWLKRFDHDLQPFLHGASEALWKGQGLSLRTSVVPRSRATATLFAMSTAPEAVSASIGMEDAELHGDLLPRLLALLKTAEVAGRGGTYPEPLPAYSALCAEVWYLRNPTGGMVDASLVPGDILERDGYPFITVMRDGDRIVLTGLSRELVQRLLTGPDPE